MGDKLGRDFVAFVVKERVARAAAEHLRPRSGVFNDEQRHRFVEVMMETLAAAAVSIVQHVQVEPTAEGGLRINGEIPAPVLRHLGLCICNPERPNLGEHLPNCPAREPGSIFPPAPVPGLGHWGDPCRYCGKAHDEVESGPCPGRLGRSCTCDEIGDEPCPVHGPEMAEQDERIGRQNFEYLANGGACPMCRSTGMEYMKAEGKLRCPDCGAEYCPRCAGVMNLDLDEHEAGLRCKCPAPRPGNEDGHFTDFPA